MNSDSGIMARRAVEALRSGVPNRDVVSKLGVFQGDITQRFVDLLAGTLEPIDGDDEAPRSLVISGAFGAGKSHILEYLRHEAIERAFVCSHVVISKETPLSDPVKLLRAAAETATLRDGAGRAVPEILFRLETDSEGFVRLFKWAHEQPGLGERTAALLKVFEERPKWSEDVVDKIAQEWSGYPMKVADMRSALREIGQHKEYATKTITQKDLVNQLWRFLPRLFHAGGYRGWVVLFDEVELILRYSKLQRAKSYAQIARLAGAAKGSKVCSLLPVFAVSDVFWGINDRDLRDYSEIAEWLRHRNKPGDTDLARDAEAGMKLLKRDMPLRGARPDELQELKEKVRQLHSQAFGWDAPAPRPRKEKLRSDTVREHVKSWIAEWDLRLLYPDYRPEIVADEVRHDYSEDPDLSKQEQGTDNAPD